MAELADAPDLGSGGAILVGSSPSPGIGSEISTHHPYGISMPREAFPNLPRFVHSLEIAKADQKPKLGERAHFTLVSSAISSVRGVAVSRRQ
jgi:hypothetical protein